MTTTIAITPRLDLADHAGAPLAALVRVEERIELDATLRELVRLRASQINGCSYCADMHWTDARGHGESERRLAHVATWRESPLFDARERAALGLCEAVTLVADTHVPDAVWDAAAAVLDDAELANLVAQIAAINAWNRVAVTTRKPPAVEA